MMSFFAKFLPLKKYCIEELVNNVELSLIEPIVIRGIANVLIVDNEVQSGMPMKESLQKHGFKNVEYYTALERITDVEKFDVILCDIQGVGESLGFKDGFELATEIKRLYPSIGIIAFSANNIGKINKTLIDDVLSKDVRLKNRNERIDAVAQKVFNPIEAWYIFRNRLLDKKVSIHTIAQLENLYVKKRIKRESLTEEDVRKFLNDISIVATIVGHLIKLSGLGV